jgi:hypothetical protein
LVATINHECQIKCFSGIPMPSGISQRKPGRQSSSSRGEADGIVIPAEFGSGRLPAERIPQSRSLSADTKVDLLLSRIIYDREVARFPAWRAGNIEYGAAETEVCPVCKQQIVADNRRLTGFDFQRPAGF